MAQERESLKSRLGFILISAGCAIGMGNVWKFPYMAGSHGGAIFVLIYLIFLVIMGIPVMTMEFATGRASRKSPVLLYQQLEKPGAKWHIQGNLMFAGNVILMMFYTTVSAWVLQYFIEMIGGNFTGLDADAVANQFGAITSNPAVQIGYMAIVVVAGFLICSFGVQKSLEKVTKVMMIALLCIMVILAVNSFFMSGAQEGLAFYLVPSWEKFIEADPFKVIVGAMTQAFFTLSLGIGSMAIFGSYINKDRSLLGEAINVTILDTFVAITAGLIIFPACFSYGVDVNAGPPLIFITLPNIFNQMPLGNLWGSLFFLFMFFAAFSTVLAVFENIISCTCDKFNISRKKASIFCCIAIFLLSIPCILGFNLLSSFTPFGEGSNILDLEDFVVSYLLLPIGSLVFVLFCTSKYGWGWDNFVNEANEGKGLKVKQWMKVYMKYVLPIIVIIYFVLSMLTFFKII